MGPVGTVFWGIKAVKILHFSTAVIAAALLCGAVAAKGIAQGHMIPGDGNIAQTEAADDADHDFGGILAPRTHDENGVPLRPQEPKGYRGVLPGALPDEDAAAGDAGRKPRMSVKPGRSIYAPEQNLPPLNDKVSRMPLPKITYAPGFGEDMPVLTSDDIKLIAQLHQHDIDFNRLPPDMEKRLGLPEGTSKMLNNFRLPRIDGMVPVEFTAKRNIDAVMKVVAGKTGDEQRRAARTAYDHLSSLASGYRSLKAVPKSIYVRLGAGDGYLEDQQEGYANALARLQEALDALEQLK